MTATAAFDLSGVARLMAADVYARRARWHEARRHYLRAASAWREAASCLPHRLALRRRLAAKAASCSRRAAARTRRQNRQKNP